MKYRRLTSEELKSLEQEFITFLSSHQITAQEWEEYKATSPEAAEEMINLFSDIVFDKILSDITFLELRDDRGYRVFRFGPKNADMIWIQYENVNPSRDSESIPENWQDNPDEFTIQTATKTYTEPPNEEKFSLLQAGAEVIKDSDLFDLIDNPKQESPKN